MDTGILDRAMIYAVKAHKGIERRGKDFPYIVHPMEAVSIVATMTSDQELLAAAALHDVIEDTEVTYEDIDKEFGKRIADLVEAETDKVYEGTCATDSWHVRKQGAIDRIKGQSKEAKMVALGDKLSNIRAIARDYDEIGDELWSRFHTKDPFEHEWHYRGLADSLSELAGTEAYTEFTALIDKVFCNLKHPFSIESNNNIYYIRGMLDGINTKSLVDKMDPDGKNILDFSKVDGIDFAGQRALMRAYGAGKIFMISNASETVAAALDNTGVSSFISTCKKPRSIDLKGFKKSGGGAESETYYSPDGDEMIKLYCGSFSNPLLAEHERRYAQKAFVYGIPSPMVGDLIVTDGKYGISFERIKNKQSMSRAIANDLSKIDYYAKQFSDLCKILHSTKSDRSIFPSAKDKFLRIVENADTLNDTQKAKFTSLIEELEDTDTFIHGDLHMGNVILADGDALYIDLGDIGYGNPLLDLGMTYFTSHGKSPKVSDFLYHNTPDTMEKFWNSFAKYYFNADTEEKLAEIDTMIKPFAALRILWIYDRSQGKAKSDPLLAAAFKNLTKDFL